MKMRYIKNQLSITNSAITAAYPMRSLSSLGKKNIMAATGLLLGGFLVVHTAGNSTIFFGREPFLSYAAHLHAFGFVLHILELGLLTLFLLHIVTGLSLYLHNWEAAGTGYAVNRSAGGRSWGSRTMIWSGLGILLFVLVHLWNFHFPDHNAPGFNIADLVGTILHSAPYSLFYAVGLVLLGLHTSHGFWSLFQTLGINHPRYNGAIRTISWFFCGTVTLIFLAIVLLLLVNGSQLLH